MTKQDALELIEKAYGEWENSEHDYITPANKIADALEASGYCSESVRALVKSMAEAEYVFDFLTPEQLRLYRKICGE